MEHAPLRPVPSRPAGPVDPATATREVAAALPSLSPVEARALGLVALAERPRTEVASTLGIDQGELGALLAGARKELRRSVAVLGGSGWCERAEGLISDRLDGELREADTARLDAHLRNCPRCVDHERRLVQATDALMQGLGLGAGPGPSPGAQRQAPLEKVEDEPGLPAGAAEGAPALPAAEDAPALPAAEAAPAVTLPGEGSRAPTEGEIAAAAEVLVVARTRRQLAAALTWNALVLLAVLLAIVTIGFTVAGVLGAQL